MGDVTITLPERRWKQIEVILRLVPAQSDADALARAAAVLKAYTNENIGIGAGNDPGRVDYGLYRKDTGEQVAGDFASTREASDALPEIAVEAIIDAYLGGPVKSSVPPRGPPSLHHP